MRSPAPAPAPSSNDGGPNGGDYGGRNDPSRGGFGPNQGVSRNEHDAIGGYGSKAANSNSKSDGGGGDGGGSKPIVLDLDNDGVELVAMDDSSALFDMNDDGWRLQGSL